MTTYGKIVESLRILGFNDESEELAQVLLDNRDKRPKHPIQSYQMFNRLSRSVQDRLERLNPDGVEEGCVPRGWHRKFRFGWEHDVVRPREFIKAQGIDAYRAVPRELWMRHGCQKAMRRVDYLDCVWKVK